MNTSTTNEILDVLPGKIIKNNDTIGTRLKSTIKEQNTTTNFVSKKNSYILSDN